MVKHAAERALLTLNLWSLLKSFPAPGGAAPPPFEPPRSLPLRGLGCGNRNGALAWELLPGDSYLYYLLVRFLGRQGPPYSSDFWGGRDHWLKFEPCVQPVCAFFSKCSVLL
jgi:hypothetical protein